MPAGQEQQGQGSQRPPQLEALQYAGKAALPGLEDTQAARTAGLVAGSGGRLGWVQRGQRCARRFQRRTPRLARLAQGQGRVQHGQQAPGDALPQRASTQAQAEAEQCQAQVAGQRKVRGAEHGAQAQALRAGQPAGVAEGGQEHGQAGDPQGSDASAVPIDHVTYAAMGQKMAA